MAELHGRLVDVEVQAGHHRARATVVDGLLAGLGTQVSRDPARAAALCDVVLQLGCLVVGASWPAVWAQVHEGVYVPGATRCGCGERRHPGERDVVWVQRHLIDVTRAAVGLVGSMSTPGGLQ